MSEQLGGVPGQHVVEANHLETASSTRTPAAAQVRLVEFHIAYFDLFCGVRAFELWLVEENFERTMCSVSSPLPPHSVVH